MSERRFNLADYVTVQERVNRFWADYPTGNIITTLESDPTDFTTCRYRAELYRDQSDERPAATGWAFEVAGSGMANKTSHEENCETSAIGRALANLGYATSQKDRPSREEMSKTERHPARPPQRPPAQQPPANVTQPPESAPTALTMNDLEWRAARIEQDRWKAIARKLREAKWKESEWVAWFKRHGFDAWFEMTNQQANDLIADIAAGNKDGEPPADDTAQTTFTDDEQAGIDAAMDAEMERML